MTAQSRVLAAVLGAVAILVAIGMGAVLFGETAGQGGGALGVGPAAPSVATPASPTATVSPAVETAPEAVPTAAPVAQRPPEPDEDHPLRKQIDQLVLEFLDLNAPADETQLALHKAAEKMAQVDAVIARLSALGEQAVPHLLAALEAHVNPSVKVFLAKGLVRMATPGADEALAGLFRRVPNMAVKTAVIYELRNRTDPDVGLVTVGLYEAELEAARAARKKGIPDRSGGIRAALLRNLGKLAPVEHLAAITQSAQHDPDPSVRGQAVDLLSKCPDPLAVSVLQRMLDEERNRAVLQSAIVSYARLTRDASIPALEAMMRRDHGSDAVRVKASVVYALGQVGGPRAEQMLQSVASYDPDPKIRQRAAGTLASLRRNATAGGDQPKIDVGGATVPLRPAVPDPQPTQPSGSTGGDGTIPTLPGGAQPVPPQTDPGQDPK